jgi:hypothetical protein
VASARQAERPVLSITRDALTRLGVDASEAVQLTTVDGQDEVELGLSAAERLAYQARRPVASATQC